MGALCWVIQGKAEGFEFFSLEPGDTALFGHTWQFGADLEIAADQQPIKARVVGGTSDSVDFSGTVQKNHFRETVKFTGDGRMHKDLKIFKPDGSTLRVIDLNATRVGARRQPDKERGIP